MKLKSLNKILVTKISLLFVAAFLLTFIVLQVGSLFLTDEDKADHPALAKQQLSKEGSADTKPDGLDDELEPGTRDKGNSVPSSESNEVGDQPSLENTTPKKQKQPNNGSDPSSPPEIYAVQPIIFFGADTPYDKTSFRNQVDINFQGVRTWYQGQLGKTFKLLPAVLYASALTETQLANKYPGGGGMWFDGLATATAANGLELCSDHRFYYFVTPLDNVWGGWVGAENLDCSHVIPGTASIPSHMGRLIGGIVDPDWPEWWADEVREAQGGVAHEVGHGLGAECMDNVCNGLPHADPEDDSIMYEWWNFNNGAGFTSEEKQRILRSAYIN